MKAPKIHNVKFKDKSVQLTEVNLCGKINYDFTFKTPDDLTTLLNMGEKDIIILDKESMNFKKFYNNYFLRASRIFPYEKTQT